MEVVYMQVIVKTVAGDGHDLWEVEKAKDRFFNSSTKSGGQRRRGQKGKLLRRRRNCLEKEFGEETSQQCQILQGSQ